MKKYLKRKGKRDMWRLLRRKRGA